MTAHEHDARSNDLKAILRARIRRDGPISFRDWMEAALYDPEYGYYQRDDLTRWGRAGDYRTAPETSVLFGATFAKYFAECWRKLGEPAAWTIFEAGAGNGNFAHACLTELRDNHSLVYAATTYVIDEIAEGSQAIIRETLRGFEERIQFNRIVELPERSLEGILFVNELLDALPVERIMLLNSELFELQVDNGAGGDFRWCTTKKAPPEVAEYLAGVGIELAEGQVAELGLEARNWWTMAASKLGKGYAIAVDYGREADELFDAKLRPEGTLRAIARHQILDDPLQDPGHIDLTVDVDWTSIRQANEAAGMTTYGLFTLDGFLRNAGVVDIIEREIASSDPIRAAQLTNSARELILPGGLAQSFQVLVQSK